MQHSVNTDEPRSDRRDLLAIKVQTSDIYRERKIKMLLTNTENLKRLSLQITKIYAF